MRALAQTCMDMDKTHTHIHMEITFAQEEREREKRKREQMLKEAETADGIEFLVRDCGVVNVWCGGSVGLAWSVFPMSIEWSSSRGIPIICIHTRACVCVYVCVCLCSRRSN